MFKDLLYYLKRPYHFFVTGILEALPAQIKYHFPARKLKILVVTGTDGKTTSSTLLYHCLKTAGKKVGLISTVAAHIGDQQADTGLHVTNPEPKALAKLMAKMVKAGINYLVLETTSHGAYQYRNWGIKPFIGGLTNVHYEHLDYHLDYDKYIQAKALILRKPKTVVLNQDDISYHKMLRALNKDKQTILTYSQEDKLPPIITQAIKARFPEKYNKMNARLVVKIAQQMEIDNKTIAQAIKSFPGVPGRVQEVENKRGYHIFVDFAHTSQGVEAVLSALRQQMKTDKSSGRLITLLGCAGLRDRSKRPVIGKIASQLADYAVFTADDPRIEGVWPIIRQMKEQLTQGHDKVISIADREEAVNFVINKLAKRGDYLAFLGKGPEKSIALANKEAPWDEVTIIKQKLALKK